MHTGKGGMERGKEGKSESEEAMRLWIIQNELKRGKG